MPIRYSLAALIGLLLLLGEQPANAQAVVQIGEYTLHASAISSMALTPEVAQRSGITRSRSRGLLNIAIRQQQADGSDVAVRAAVSADASNLAGQRQILTLREVREGDAIYYLAEPRISEGETLDFEITARPADSSGVLQARFKQVFFAPLPP